MIDSEKKNADTEFHSRFRVLGGLLVDSVSPVVVIHGGAGTLSRSLITPEREAAYRAALQEIALAAQTLLAQGVAALDVVTEAVRRFEECPLFNAGKGAVYTADERHELDACVMRGSDLAVGAVAGVTRLRNPVLAAREILLAGGPVLLIGEGAERFCSGRGLESVSPYWFGTPERLAQLRAVQTAGSRQALDHDGQSLLAAKAPRPADAPLDERHKFGTVGAVALDTQGHLAAATSTGGYTNKPPGRVGDSPIIGAGTYARDGRCAVSGTGKGEYFIRYCVGHEIASLIAYRGLSLAEATEAAMAELSEHKIGAGLVAVGADGSIVAPYNTEGMYRGWVTEDGLIHVATHDHVELAGQA